MALKYYFTYTDVRDNEFLCEIRQEGYTGDAVEIKGTCIIAMPRVPDIYTVIRGVGMTVSLEANLSLTLEDLYADNVQTFAITLRRNGQYIFRGFIDPSGLYEDMVEDAWIVTLDCIDGLGLLEDVAYLDTEGNPFFGRLSDLQVINNCLARSGVVTEAAAPLQLQTSINTRYFGLAATEDPLRNTHTNQERFYRDDGNTVMSCKEVLESTLRKYGAFIYYSNDFWRIHTFYEFAIAQRWFYTYNQLSLLEVSFRESEKTYIGSQITDEHRWVNRNQRKEIIPPAGAVKINYQYGFVQSIFQNEFFNNNGTTGAIPGWGTNAGDIDVNLGEPGAFFVTENNDDVMLSTLGTESIEQGDLLELIYGYTMQPQGHNTANAVNFTVRLRVVLQNATNTYSYIDNQWVSGIQNFTTAYTLGGFNALNDQVLERELPEAPITGELSVQILRITTSDAVSAQLVTRQMEVNHFRINVSTNEDLEGESHTYQVANGSYRAEDLIEVSVGDVPSDIYLGALYEQDAETNTALWATVFQPTDVAPNQALLNVLCEQIALYRRDPSYHIKGDVFGYFDIDAFFEFDLVPGRVFMISHYEYDTVNNVITAEFKELRRGGSFGLSYVFELDYGNTETPTVTGV